MLRYWLHRALRAMGLAAAGVIILATFAVVILTGELLPWLLPMGYEWLTHVAGKCPPATINDPWCP